MGWREKIEGSDKLTETISWLTYEQAYEQAKIIGQGLTHPDLNLVPELCEYQDFKMRLFAIYGPNSPMWILLDIAAVMYNLTSVPIYDTLGESATSFMFDQTNITTCICTTSHA